MKLTDIRCETCPLFKERGAVGEHKGWCTAGLGVVYRDDMCATHPLWQQALEEERSSSCCPKHPRYQAKRKPTSDCEHCKTIWERKGQSDETTGRS